MKQLNWRLAIIVLLLGSGLVLVAHVSAQQAVRLGTNAQPATMAAAVSSAFQSGADPVDAVGATVPGFGQGDQPTVIIYDPNLKPIGTNIRGYTDKPGQLQWKPPVGTFHYNLSQSMDNRFTWEPAGGPRLATVLVKAGDNGYVVAATNLAETESTENTLAFLALAGWTGVLLVVALALVL